MTADRRDATPTDVGTRPDRLDALPARTIERYRCEGCVVLRGVFDAAPLAAEVAAAFADGFASTGPTNRSAAATIAFRYLPMMVERTPLSLHLLRRFRRLAEQFVGAEVLPVRAKAVEYHGASSWHRDSDMDVASLGFACYLEPLTADAGALRVVPGSHRNRSAARGVDDATVVPVETVPGDVIVFDEHLLHSSFGGVVRRQWRVDYIARPTTDQEHDVAHGYFAGMYSPDWDGGYDVDNYPTYGPHWRRICPAADDVILDAVGAYAASDEEEAATRRRRGTATAVGVMPRAAREVN